MPVPVFCHEASKSCTSQQRAWVRLCISLGIAMCLAAAPTTGLPQAATDGCEYHTESQYISIHACLQGATRAIVDQDKTHQAFSAEML